MRSLTPSDLIVELATSPGISAQIDASTETVAENQIAQLNKFPSRLLISCSQLYKININAVKLAENPRDYQLEVFGEEHKNEDNYNILIIEDKIWNLIDLTRDRRLAIDFKKTPLMKLPFINERINKSLVRILRDEKINARITFKTRNIYNLTFSQSKDLDIEPLEQRGIIYEIVCKTCELNNTKINYIGETGRRLSDRLKEHF